MTTTAYKQSTRTLQVDSPLGKDVLLLTSFSGREEISKPFRYRLEFLSTKDNVDPVAIVGKPVGVQLVNPSGSLVHFHGRIARWAHRGKDERLTRYAAEVVPWLWFLSRTADCRIFQSMSVPAIIEKIFSDLGFADYEMQISGQHPTWDYCVQYRETDLNFISRLMEQEGIFYYFKHALNKHTLVIADKKNAYLDAPDSDAHFAAAKGVLESLDNVTSWEHGYLFTSGKFAQTDYNFETPSTSLMANANTLVKLSDISKYEVYDYPGEYETKNVGQDESVLRMEELEAGYDVVQATGRCRTLKPGYRFKVKSHQIKPEEGKQYVVTAVQHEVSVGGYETGGSPSVEYTNSFTCIPDSVTFRPARTTPKPAVYGLQTAVVVGPAGTEIYTDKYGRIKVQFHWDREGKKNENSSCWIRVAQAWAGRQWGAVFTPRIGMEVLVEFLEGDPDRPLVTGCVYNAEDMPPYELPGNATKSGLKTRSSQNGAAENFNELRFEDKKGAEEIYFHAERNFIRHVENDDSLTVEGNQTIEVKKDRTEKVTEGNEKVTIEQGNRDVIVSKGNDKHEVTLGNRTVHVGSGNDTHDIDTGDRTVTLGKGNDSLTVKQGDLAIKVSLGKITIEALKEIELKVGKSVVKLTQSGLSINGINVKVEGTAQTEISGLLTKINGSAMLKAGGGMVMLG